MSTDTQKPPASGKPQRQPRLPERKIGPFPGGVGVAIWINQAEAEQGSRSFRSITINPRRYFDQESKQWIDAKSYNPSDLPSLIFALQKAQEYVYETPLPEQAASDAEAAGPLSEEEVF
jgi:hypothetical protein